MFRDTAQVTPLIEELRESLFVEDYANISWPNFRDTCAEEDMYRPPGVILKSAFWCALCQSFGVCVLLVCFELLSPGTPSLVYCWVFRVMNLYERFKIPFLRRRAQDWLLEVLKKEDEFTDYIDIGPVSKAMHVIIAWITDGPKARCLCGTPLSHTLLLPRYPVLHTAGVFNPSSAVSCAGSPFQASRGAPARLHLGWD
jgi:hypothetical protein